MRVNLKVLADNIADAIVVVAHALAIRGQCTSIIGSSRSRERATDWKGGDYRQPLTQRVGPRRRPPRINAGGSEIAMVPAAQVVRAAPPVYHERCERSKQGDDDTANPESTHVHVSTAMLQSVRFVADKEETQVAMKSRGGLGIDSFDAHRKAVATTLSSLPCHDLTSQVRSTTYPSFVHAG